MKKIFLLSGAVVVVFGCALFTGCAHINRETTGEYRNDSEIASEVNQIIVHDPDAQYLKIEVTTTKGDVVLMGFVYDRDTEERIVEKIKHIPDVKSVKSLLKVEVKK